MLFIYINMGRHHGVHYSCLTRPGQDLWLRLYHQLYGKQIVKSIKVCYITISQSMPQRALHIIKRATIAEHTKMYRSVINYTYKAWQTETHTIHTIKTSYIQTIQKLDNIWIRKYIHIYIDIYIVKWSSTSWESFLKDFLKRNALLTMM